MKMPLARRREPFLSGTKAFSSRSYPCEAFGEAAPSAAIGLSAICEIRGFSSALSALASGGDP